MDSHPRILVLRELELQVGTRYVPKTITLVGLLLFPSNLVRLEQVYHIHLDMC